MVESTVELERRVHFFETVVPQQLIKLSRWRNLRQECKAHLLLIYVNPEIYFGFQQRAKTSKYYLSSKW